MPLHHVPVDIDKPEGYRTFCDALEQDRVYLNDKYYVLSCNPVREEETDIRKLD